MPPTRRRRSACTDSSAGELCATHECAVGSQVAEIADGVGVGVAAVEAVAEDDIADDALVERLAGAADGAPGVAATFSLWEANGATDVSVSLDLGSTATPASADIGDAVAAACDGTSPATCTIVVVPATMPDAIEDVTIVVGDGADEHRFVQVR